MKHRIALELDLPENFYVPEGDLGAQIVADLIFAYTVQQTRCSYARSRTADESARTLYQEGIDRAATLERAIRDCKTAHSVLR